MEKRPLFVFEMANNHQGSVAHGKKIIEAMHAVCKDFPEFEYAFKFQYRNLDTFIHPEFKSRLDIKNVKRFLDTRLSPEDFKEMIAACRQCGFTMICTPFDEPSVDRIVEHGYDYIKIASCSTGDWPLIEKIAAAKKPVIASTAGSKFETVKNVVSFFENRGIDVSLMHCVAEYPTPISAMQMNQIDFLREHFPSHRIGFSTHESPSELLPVEIAVGKGVAIFEKHVGVPTDTITLNGYSANPEEVRAWLAAARNAFACCGVAGERYTSSEKERADLAALERGVFAKRDLTAGTKLSPEDFYLAFPRQEGQLTAVDLSKYNEIVLEAPVTQDKAILHENVQISNTSAVVASIVKNIISILRESGVVVPVGSVFDISHHYGLPKFYETGAVLIDCVNREYCKKILIVMPGQNHPCHYHKEKEETFVILHGELFIVMDGEEKKLSKGDVITVERGARHSFSSKNGCVFEEISTTHIPNDSYYDEKETFVSPRKTKVHLTKEMMERING
ncbi:MAG: N-acetylneuraminate synthase family protein [Selenomonadaceae bacterium]|nr:N-acetylneuraminate synthase family protein [Selenomonadaceae bacterium]